MRSIFAIWPPILCSLLVSASIHKCISHQLNGHQSSTEVEADADAGQIQWQPGAALATLTRQLAHFRQPAAPAPLSNGVHSQVAVGTGEQSIDWARSAAGPSKATGPTARKLAKEMLRLSDKMTLPRLAKKADWKALSVKLAKVFLQYFLDLLLTDMFGTTGVRRLASLSTGDAARNELLHKKLNQLSPGPAHLQMASDFAAPAPETARP